MRHIKWRRFPILVKIGRLILSKINIYCFKLNNI
ncbi:unknown [[Mannheimia] succiniciproducens MBEL55E]|uniref:Uncharacterized protein n=1 Tax=Mannheimia succiniciproducens (strain KCTC 0769BP / MBEL55E) TaxID=221988 RepID=Q65VU3_MANSM|nr:unknown [[Mannheimia] succiniciproducens MBEL55E]